MLAMSVIALIIILSIFIQTKGNDLAPIPSSTAPEPQSDNQFFLDPITCIHDVKTIPKCMDAVLHFRFKQVTKKCCYAMLSLPESCFGVLFPIPYVYHLLLKAACKITYSPLIDKIF
ncbi:Prolamin-like domain [Arabidopsis thaliana x Arabidopsis arenosa]|uniref:Prolamin-like domain n=2 Tax=Arabidopsis TaxID=3701 RepID=A0A8T1ZYK6_ARASU|nr:Prolamin-like domain [Arabidopsis thaliana x Arabidopsis arenosa]KAG7564546.1 Prolamin-like domain [Arabidopsis suecica]